MSPSYRASSSRALSTTSSPTTVFGKTVIAAWLIVQRRVNTLVQVHRAPARGARPAPQCAARIRISTAADRSAESAQRTHAQAGAKRRLEVGHQRERGARPVIPHDYITEWRAQAPWVQALQVEQDLVISRASIWVRSQTAPKIGPKSLLANARVGPARRIRWMSVWRRGWNSERSELQEPA